MFNKLYILPAILGLLTLLSACNAKDEPDKIDEQVAQSVAVTKFSLQPNLSVMDGLDSVYFSIDLEHKVIYNADSLPVGTRIDKLVPVITYPSTVNGAEITMTGGKTRTGTVNYKENPSDSIDFSGNVSLLLTAIDENISMTYRIKVNVHKCVPDSLMWDNEAVASLPCRMASPRNQRTVTCGDKIISLIEEADATFTLASAKNPGAAEWSKDKIAFDFIPAIRTLTACNGSLFMLDSNGVLMTSSDNGISWTKTDTRWLNVIGEYDGSVIGIAGETATPKFDIYPRPADFTPYVLPDDFPIEGLSTFNVFSTKWAVQPTGFLCGGLRNNNLLSATWAYDGENWAKISNTPLPALKEPVIIPYYSYRKTTTSWIQTEFSVWLCMGGILADGKINDTLFISYDNGINWRVASEQMQYPSFVRPGYQADGVIFSTKMEADMEANWRKIASARKVPQMRVNYNIDGKDITWECPYIYLFGGKNGAEILNPEIRRAVLARLTFAPIF